MKILFCNSVEEIKNIEKKESIYKTKIKFKCSSCGKEQEIFLNTLKKNNYVLLCRCCKLKETTLKNFGVDNPSKSKIIKEKKKLTTLKHFGVENPNQSNIVKEKIKQTNLEKYKATNPLASKEIQNQIKQTNIQKYNTEFPTQNESIKEKSKQTNLKKFGVENWAQTEEAAKFHRNIWKLTFAKYYEKNKENWADLHKSKNFKFEDIYFDSYTELCFYVYHLDQNYNIKRNTKSFKYTFEGKEHYYFPDFEISNQLIEIKGNQFLKEDNTWCNPYAHEQDALYEAKHQCALQNNVKIIYYSNCKKYIEYVNQKYGENFFK